MEFLYSGPAGGPAGGPTLLLAHGAGAAMDSSWMNTFCGLLAERDIHTARFEFSYMAARRTGGRKPQPRAEAVIEEYMDAVSSVDLAGGSLVIGGKSFGGRVASLVADSAADSARVRGLVCLGYPFHPIGKPEQLRTAHLMSLRTPTLVCQGTRDLLGNRDEVAGYGLPPMITFCWLDDGDHDFRPRKASGRTAAENLDEAANAVGGFLAQVAC